MSDMPEDIWLDFFGEVEYMDYNCGDTRYIRYDIHAAVLAELTELRERVKDKVYE